MLRVKKGRDRKDPICQFVAIATEAIHRESLRHPILMSGMRRLMFPSVCSAILVSRWQGPTFVGRKLGFVGKKLGIDGVKMSIQTLLEDF